MPFPWEVDTPDETGESPRARFEREIRERDDLMGQYAHRFTSHSDRSMSQEDCIQDYMDEIDWRVLRSRAYLAARLAESMQDHGFRDELVAEAIYESIELDMRAQAHERWMLSSHYHNRRLEHVERQRHELNGRPIGDVAGSLRAGRLPNMLPVTTGDVRVNRLAIEAGD